MSPNSYQGKGDYKLGKDQESQMITELLIPTPRTLLGTRF